ncbi:PilN domain-containing protein [Rubeoparvulum massiliense]|uniref:PilN domain-containing protein n=1 Tax=Rubeoparvulum massiliense TaxID=1631346 RepID=UPI00065DC14D|nr:hypothetical protein [Rubeoparvulum massiliense]
MSVDINLLPKRENKKVVERIFWITILAIVAVVLIWSRVQFQAAQSKLEVKSQYESYLEAEITMLENQLAEYRGEEALLTYGKAVAMLEAASQPVVPLIQKIIGLLPSDGTIVSLWYEGDGQFALSIKTNSLQQIAAFNYHVEHALGVERFKLQQVSTEVDENHSATVWYEAEFKLMMVKSSVASKGGETHE